MKLNPYCAPRCVPDPPPVPEVHVPIWVAEPGITTSAVLLRARAAVVNESTPPVRLTFPSVSRIVSSALVPAEFWATLSNHQSMIPPAKLAGS